MKKDHKLSTLKEIEDVQLDLDIDLQSYSTMGLKATGSLITCFSLDSLKRTLQFLNKENLPYFPLGWGANQVLKGGETPYLKIQFPYDENYLNEVRSEYQLPGSLSVAKLSSHAAKFNLKGWEVVTGIPASLSGAVYMNAGTNLGEIGSLVSEVRIVSKKGEEKIIKGDALKFSYRKNNFCEDGDFIYQVTLKNLGQDENVSKTIREYLLLRNQTQPMKAKTCGCVFKNHTTGLRAGKAIDDLGLKGHQVGQVRVSPIHGNFFENLGGGTIEEFLELLNFVRKEIKDKLGVTLELEVKIQ